LNHFDETCGIVPLGGLGDQRFEFVLFFFGEFVFYVGFMGPLDAGEDTWAVKLLVLILFGVRPGKVVDCGCD
jgi:hypothetical protein